MKENAFGTRPAPPVTPPPGHGRNTRQLLASGVTSFQVAGTNTLYIVVTDRTLWRGTIGTADGKAVTGKVAAFQALADGRLFVQGDDGRLRAIAQAGTPDQLTAEGVAAFHATANVVYVLGKDRTLSRIRIGSPGRTLVDSEVIGFQAIDDTVVDVLTADGTLWRETGSKDHRELVAMGIAHFREIDGATYVLTTSNRTLWRQTASGANKVDEQVEWFQPVDKRVVYVLGRDGRLWREVGDQTGRESVEGEVMLQPGAFQTADAAKVYVLMADHQLWAETMPPVR